MTAHDAKRIANMLEEAGIGSWLAAEPKKRERILREEAAAIDAELLDRTGHAPTRSTLDTMLDDPSGMKPLIQSFGSSMTIAARAMIYCILRGATIESISFEYDRQRRSRLAIRLRLADGTETTFESDDIWDFELLRHLGSAKLGGKPMLHGYYAFRT